MITYRLKVSYNEPVKNCYDCAFCCDMLFCLATSDGEKTIYPNGTMPERCPLKIYEESEENKNV